MQFGRLRSKQEGNLKKHWRVRITRERSKCWIKTGEANSNFISNPRINFQNQRTDSRGTIQTQIPYDKVSDHAHQVKIKMQENWIPGVPRQIRPWIEVSDPYFGSTIGRASCCLFTQIFWLILVKDSDWFCPRKVCKVGEATFWNLNDMIEQRKHYCFWSWFLYKYRPWRHFKELFGGTVQETPLKILVLSVL